MILIEPYRLASPRKLSAGETEKKACGVPFFRCTIIPKPWKQAAKLYDSGVTFAGDRVLQLASIPKTKRQAARQSTHNGSDDISEERKPRQRPASRCWNSADVRVHRATTLTLRADFKRLIPLSKYSSNASQPKSPKGLRYA